MGGQKGKCVYWDSNFVPGTVVGGFMYVNLKDTVLFMSLIEY